MGIDGLIQRVARPLSRPPFRPIPFPLSKAEWQAGRGVGFCFSGYLFAHTCVCLKRLQEVFGIIWLFQVYLQLVSQTLHHAGNYQDTHLSFEYMEE